MQSQRGACGSRQGSVFQRGGSRSGPSEADEGAEGAARWRTNSERGENKGGGVARSTSDGPPGRMLGARRGLHESPSPAARRPPPVLLFLQFAFSCPVAAHGASPKPPYASTKSSILSALLQRTCPEPTCACGACQCGPRHARQPCRLHVASMSPACSHCTVPLQASRAWRAAAAESELATAAWVACASEP